MDETDKTTTARLPNETTTTPEKRAKPKPKKKVNLKDPGVINRGFVKAQRKYDAAELRVKKLKAELAKKEKELTTADTERKVWAERLQKLLGVSLTVSPPKPEPPTEEKTECAWCQKPGAVATGARDRGSGPEPACDLCQSEA